MDISILITNGIRFEINVSLKTKTWIHTGGIAAYWIQPKTIEQLSIVIKYLNKENIYFEVVGHTSNLYFQNNYNPNVVISTISINYFSDDKDMLICECGCNMKVLAHYCVEKGYIGYEGLIDLPGTVAGAVYNNSSCYKCAVSDLLIKLDYLNKEGDIITLQPYEMQYQKRSSILKRDFDKKQSGIILKVFFKKELSNFPKKIIEKATQNHIHRQFSQEGPKLNLGSVYSIMPYKPLPTFIARVVGKLCSITKIDYLKKQRLIRTIILYLFGGRNLHKYISNKTINCFIWRDGFADKTFFKYQQFIEKIADYPELEIEIKTERK